MIFKAQFFFNQFNQGWVETWYISTTSIDAATKLATNIASNLVDIRADTCSIIGFRLVTVDATTPKQTIRIAVSIPGDRLTIGQGKLTGSENEDVTQTCWNVTCRFEDASQRTVQWRGLLDADVARDNKTGASQPSDTLTKQFQSMSKALVNAGVMQQRQAPGIPVDHVLQIMTDPKNPNATALLLDDDTNVTIGDKVRFTGVPLADFPWLKGQWKIIGENTTAETVSIGYPYRYAAPSYPVKMTIQKVSPVWTALIATVAQSFQHRKTGRPFSPTRGRSRGVRYRHR